MIILKRLVGGKPKIIDLYNKNKGKTYCFDMIWQIFYIWSSRIYGRDTLFQRSVKILERASKIGKTKAVSVVSQRLRYECEFAAS